MTTNFNNVSINNSLSVNTNSILGVDNTSTLIINSKPTFNSDMTISGNINQTSANTFSTGTGNINLNGNITVNPTKSLTSGAISCSSINNSGSYNAISCSSINNSGTLTQGGISTFSNIIKVNSGQSVYITDSGLTNFLRMHHSGAASYIDFTGVLNFRNSTSSSANPTDTFNINNSTNQGTFNYNLNTNGITNSTNAITNNAALYQNSNATFSNVIVAPGIKSTSAAFYCGSFNDFDSTAISSPKIINGIASGNGDGATYTQFNLAINSWQGVGFLYSNSGGPSVCKLVIDNRTGNLSTLGTINCASITSTGAINCDSLTSTGAINMTSLTSETINKSKFLSFKGYSFYNAAAATGFSYYFTKYDGTTSTYTNAPIVVDSNCFHIRITYAFNTLNSSSQNIKGCTEYVFIKSNSTSLFEQYSPWSVGTNSYQPTFNLTETNQITILWAINTNQLINNQSYLYWNYAVFVN
jgi:hypothetical protein